MTWATAEIGKFKVAGTHVICKPVSTSNVESCLNGNCTAREKRSAQSRPRA
jgi:hypothetical protein